MFEVGKWERVGGLRLCIIMCLSVTFQDCMQNKDVGVILDLKTDLCAYPPTAGDTCATFVFIFSQMNRVKIRSVQFVLKSVTVCEKFCNKSLHLVAKLRQDWMKTAK